MELFGCKMTKKICTSLVHYSIFFEVVFVDFVRGIVTVEQLAHYFLFYLLSVIVFSNLLHASALWLVPLLRDFDKLP